MLSIYIGHQIWGKFKTNIFLSMNYWSKTIDIEDTIDKVLCGKNQALLFDIA